MQAQLGRDQVIALNDGRRLAFAEWGPADGMPVLCFHGLPNSRLVHFRDAPARQGVRLLLPDRPGFGRSDVQPGRSILGWVDDVRELADALGLRRFALVGISAGGPHAAACAWAMPDRVAALGLVSAVGPVVDVAEIADGLPSPWVEFGDLARQDRAAAERLAHGLCSHELDLLHRHPERWIRDWRESAPLADLALIADPAVLAMYLGSCLEATVDGYAAELTLLVADPWGFTLPEIRAPSFLWHGTQDLTVPTKVAEYMGSVIPDCRTTIYHQEGHLLVHNHEDEILKPLAQALRR